MTFISENLAQLLRVKRIRMPISVVGGIHAGMFRHATQIKVSSRKTHVPSFSTTALILKSLTSYTPKRNLDISLSHLLDLTWADADPTSLDPIHLIIGADLYSDLILDGVRKGNVGQPVAQNSVLGWVISDQSDRSHMTRTRPQLFKRLILLSLASRRIIFSVLLLLMKNFVDSGKSKNFSDNVFLRRPKNNVKSIFTQLVLAPRTDGT